MSQVGIGQVYKQPRWIRRLRKNASAWVGLVLIVLVVGFSLGAGFVAPLDPLAQNIAMSLMPPSADHWLGTDSFGRDVFSRLLHAGRVSLLVGVSAIAIAMVVGTAIGVAAGYIGGWFDNAVMGLLDVMLSFPTLLLGMIVAVMLGSTIENLILAVAVTEIAPFARVARGPTIRVVNREFVVASRSLGASHPRLLAVHVLPNIASDVLVMASMWLATAIRTEASLSFVGLGVQPPTPTWGSMVREGFENILDAPWLVVAPSLAILLIVLAFNLIGDGLRDAIDPRTE